MEAAVGFAQALALVRTALIAALIGVAFGVLCVGVAVVGEQPPTIHQPDPPVAQVIP